MSIFKAQRQSIKGVLADGGEFTAPINGDMKIACLTGTITVSETINGTYSANSQTIPSNQYLVLKDIIQGEKVKITGGTANYHFYA
jgi:hypothetical protein